MSYRMNSRSANYVFRRSTINACLENKRIENIPIRDLVRVEREEHYTLIKYRKHEVNSLQELIPEELKKYKKSAFNGDILDGELVNYRSLVFNQDGSYLMSFTPPKSTQITGTASYEEFVEGTMVSVFYNKFLETWEIATRSVIGGRNVFYQNDTNKTFRSMFLEAMTNKLLEFEMLYKNYCYTFVVQHPQNRVVVPFHQTNLYLVATYEIINLLDEIYIHEIPQEEVCRTHPEMIKHVSFPKKYSGTHDEIVEKYCSETTPYNIVGVMMKSGSTRDKIRNPVYERVRKLRGNQPKQQYQYLALRREGRVREFLKYFPELRKKCAIWREQVHAFTRILHQSYMNVFVLHKMPIQDTLYQLRPHIIALHEKYIHSFKPLGERVTKEKVIEYVNSLHPSQLLFVLNTPVRMQHKDALNNTLKE